MGNRLKRIHILTNLIQSSLLCIGFAFVFIYQRFLASSNRIFFDFLDPSFKCITILSMLYVIIDFPIFVYVIISSLNLKELKQLLNSILLVCLNICGFIALVTCFITVTGGV